MKNVNPGLDHSSFIAAASWLISPDSAVLEGGAVMVRDGMIAEVGTVGQLLRAHGDHPVVDYPGCALVPGLVNAHIHLELTHFPSWRLRSNLEHHPKRFVDWIIQLIKIKRGLTADDYQSSVLEGMRICLESGTTSVGEIVSFPSVADTYARSMLGGRLFFEVVGHDRGKLQHMLERAVQAAGAAETDRFSCGLSPHATYTIGDDNYGLIMEYGQSRGYPFAIHISESSAETEFLFNSSGQLAEVFYPFVSWEQYLMPPRKCSSTELLHRAGMLKPGTLAIHCVHVSRADGEILKNQGAIAVLCPRSNERLNAGVAPVALLKKLGIPLVLGTDSLASNDSLSMWDEMRFALEAYSGQLTPSDLFRMATIGGACALGFGDTRGVLAAGRRADFQIIGGLDQPGEKKTLLEKIIFQGSVVDVFAGGQKYVGSRE